MIDVSVYSRGTYYDVKVFITRPELLAEAEEEAYRLQEELAGIGFRTAITIHSWTV